MVFVATLDPVATGLVASLAKPGSDAPGDGISGDLIAKRLRFDQRAASRSQENCDLGAQSTSPTAAQYVQESRTAARSLGIELQILTERNPQDLEGIFVAVQRSSALVVADDAEFTARRGQIAELALRNQLPTVSGLREMVEAGGFMAYGASFGDLYRRAAGQVYARYCQARSPPNLPVEQPTKFEFVLNMRTAKTPRPHRVTTATGWFREVME